MKIEMLELFEILDTYCDCHVVNISNGSITTWKTKENLPIEFEYNSELDRFAIKSYTNQTLMALVMGELRKTSIYKGTNLGMRSIGFASFSSSGRFCDIKDIIEKELKDSSKYWRLK